MTLDLVQWLFMACCGPLAIAVVLAAFPFNHGQRWMVGLFLGAWFLLTVLTPIPRIGPLPGALFGIVLPVIAISLFIIVNPAARGLIAGANVPCLVALHVTRVAGGLFILLHLEGRLSNPFAMIAGWGDVLAASLAIPAALVAWRARPGWEIWVIGWSVIGFLDFMSAVGLGVTSQSGSPLQVFFEAPGTAILGELPWRFIPSYFVPLYIILHIALFVRLAPVLMTRFRVNAKALPTAG